MYVYAYTYIYIYIHIHIYIYVYIYIYTYILCVERRAGRGGARAHPARQCAARGRAGTRRTPRGFQGCCLKILLGGPDSKKQKRKSA